MFESYLSTNPKDIDLMEWLNDSKYYKEVERIRMESDKSKRDLLKSKLPAITPSGTFNKRNEANLISHSGFIQFDIDKLTLEQIESVKSKVIGFDYTFYCGLSVSGLGLWGLFKISQPVNHKKHFKAMERYFKYFDIAIDIAPSNVASLRGYSYDQSGYLNEDAKVFNLIYEEPKSANINLSKNLNSSSNKSANNIADDFNLNGEIESVLIAHGWKFVGKKGTNNRYTRPGKDYGISGNYCTERKLFYVWSTDPQTGLQIDKCRAFNNWAVFKQLECNGNNKETAKKLSQLGYGRKCQKVANFQVGLSDC
jgi:hypothetical protein